MGTLEQILAELMSHSYLVFCGLIAVHLLGGPSLAARHERQNDDSDIPSEGQHIRGLSTLVPLLFVALCAASTSVAQQLGSVANAEPTTISGTVLDIDGGIVPGAKVVLSSNTPDNHRDTVAGDSGFFQFEDVLSGVTYHVTISATDFADWTSAPIIPTPGRYSSVDGIRLRVATVQTSVVAATVEQLALEQVRSEETQRLFRVIPNFYVSYDTQFVPLTTKLKFELATRSLNDPATLTGFALNAGIYQMADYPHYRGGVTGYGERLGATVAGGYAHIMVGDVVLPALFHQDPRYFYQSTGTSWSRLKHAFSYAIFATGDNGQRQINYSGIGGDLVSGAVANTYYPAKDRGLAVVIRGSLIGTGGRIAYALGEQFVLDRSRRRHESE